MKAWLSLDEKKKEKIKQNSSSSLHGSKLLIHFYKCTIQRRSSRKQVMESREVEVHEEDVGTSNQVGIKNGSL